MEPVGEARSGDEASVRGRASRDRRYLYLVRQQRGRRRTHDAHGEPPQRSGQDQARILEALRDHQQRGVQLQTRGRSHRRDVEHGRQGQFHGQSRPPVHGHGPDDRGQFREGPGAIEVGGGGSAQAVMRSGGGSRAGLGRMHDIMAAYVERGDVPGIVTLVSRRGEVQVDAIGTKAVGGGDPIRRDTIFRIASLTKPIAAAATMILVEECQLRLDEPVYRLLPELANRTVLTRLDAPLDKTVPASRPITVRDLLTFRAGYGIVMAPPDTYPIQAAMSTLLLGQGPPSSSVL